MQPSPKEYKQMVKTASPSSPLFKDCLRAFLIGGAICTLGQALGNLYTAIGLMEEIAKPLTSITLIFIAVTLTAIGVFDRIAKFAGAGTLVPITGFANAVASAAIEFKSEGFILGLGAKLFTIAGPVIVYGTVASVVYGVVYWLIQTL